MQGGTVVIVVALLVAAVLLLLAVRTLGPRRGAPGVRPLPYTLIEPYESRLPELERLFVSQPREAVAAAKLLVDDMLNRMGYPVRMTNEERVRDLRGRHRPLADLYKQGSSTKSEASTEHLRQALQHYLRIAHELLDEAGREGERAGSRQELA